MTFPRDYPRMIVSDGQQIDLGNRVVAVLIIPNHMPGGPDIFDATDIDKYLGAAEAVLAGKEGVVPQRGSGGMGGPPGAMSPDPQGRTIYQRRRVRGPDRPANMGAPTPNARVMAYQDRQITCDMRHIRDWCRFTWQVQCGQNASSSTPPSVFNQTW